MSVISSVFRWLGELFSALIGVGVLMLSRGGAWRHSPRCSLGPATARQLLPLEWRSPWWAWQLGSWCLATVLAPTVWITALLLLIDPRSDHPFFWLSLMVMVALGNAVAIIRVNQLHHRQPFVDRGQLHFCYVISAAKAGAIMFIASAWFSGFAADMAGPVQGSHQGLLMLKECLWSVGLALIFCLLSFSHGGALHSRLIFSGPGWRRVS